MASTATLLIRGMSNASVRAATEPNPNAENGDRECEGGIALGQRLNRPYPAHHGQDLWQGHEPSRIVRNRRAPAYCPGVATMTMAKTAVTPTPIIPS